MSRRQAAAAQPARAPLPAGFVFGDFSTYSSGAGIPEGNYAMFFDVRMYQYKKNNNNLGDPTLSVVATAYNLDDPAAEPREQVYGLGRQAHKSFMPNPDTGKGVVPVPDAAQSSLNNATNWGFFLKSMYDSGLPRGVFTDDLSTLDGVWVHVHPIPEPEERKTMKARNTSEFEADSGPKTIPIVTEILPGGKPWENGGGMPEGAAAPAKTVAAAASTTRRRAAAPPPPPPPPAAGGEVTDEQIAEAAVNSIGEVLGKATNAKGMKKIKMRVESLAHAGKVYGDEMAAFIAEVTFADDTSLNTVLGELGYKAVGQDIVPVTGA